MAAVKIQIYVGNLEMIS